jgi:MFS family permease
MSQAGIFRSLEHRNFRIFFLGQLVSLHGTWMQSVAQSWLVYRLTGSGLMLGLTGTATLLPTLLFGLFGGVLADRFNRKKLLIAVQSLAMAQALLLAVLTLMHWITPWMIVGLALALGFVQALETPVRQSFISQLVPKAALHNAIGLNSSMFHLARFAGPAVAGFLVAWVGEGPVFVVNAISFLGVLISLRLIAPAVQDRQLNETSRYKGVWAGVHFARHHALVGSTLLLLALTSLFGGATVVLLPLYAGEIFKHGPESLGWLMAMLGVGSLIAALKLAKRQDTSKLEVQIAAACVAMALCLILFSNNKLFWMAMAILPLIGFSATSVYASSNALIQSLVPDQLRGRLMALYTVCLHGMVSLGQLALGAVADWISVPLTVLCSAVCLLLLGGGAAVVLLRSAEKSKVAVT